MKEQGRIPMSTTTTTQEAAYTTNGCHCSGFAEALEKLLAVPEGDPREEDLFKVFLTQAVDLVRSTTKTRYRHPAFEPDELLSEFCIRVRLRLREHPPAISEERIKAWLFTVLANLYIDFVREFVKSKDRDESLTSVTDGREHYALRSERSADAGVEAKSILDVLLSQLSNQQVRIVEMWFGDDDSKQQEIANALGVSSRTVRNEIKRIERIAREIKDARR